MGVGHVGAPRVFLSYRRDDTPGYAGRVYDSLVERFSEENVFMDIDTIRPGAEFAKVIASALDDCNVFLALIGPTWLESSDVAGRRRLDDPSDFVRLEIEAALRRTILVIPVMVREAEMPPRDRLPDRLAPLTGRQAFELSDQRWRRDMAELLDEIDRASRAARSIAAPIIRESRFLNRRTGWAAVALGVTATAVAMAVTFAPSGAVAGSGTPPASATPTASAATTTPQVTPARVSSTLSPEDRARIQEERHSAAMSAINGIK